MSVASRSVARPLEDLARDLCPGPIRRGIRRALAANDNGLLEPARDPLPQIELHSADREARSATATGNVSGSRCGARRYHLL